MDDRLYFAATVDQQVPSRCSSRAVTRSISPRMASISNAPCARRAWRRRVAGHVAHPEEVKPDTLNGFAVVFGVNLPAPGQLVGVGEVRS